MLQSKTRIKELCLPIEEYIERGNVNFISLIKKFQDIDIKAWVTFTKLPARNTVGRNEYSITVVEGDAENKPVSGIYLAAFSHLLEHYPMEVIKAMHIDEMMDQYSRQEIDKLCEEGTLDDYAKIRKICNNTRIIGLIAFVGRMFTVLSIFNRTTVIYIKSPSGEFSCIKAYNGKAKLYKSLKGLIEDGDEAEPIITVDVAYEYKNKSRLEEEEEEDSCSID